MKDFNDLPPESWVASNAHAFAVRDKFPVTVGHTLVIPRSVIPTWFDATDTQRASLISLIDEVRAQLDTLTPKPDGYNVGFNAGEAAGQTVMHLHVHVIPRYLGDMDDPRGGVRHVIPSQGNYLRAAQPLSTGGAKDPFSRHILPLFETSDEIAIVAAFVQESGVLRIRAALRDAVERGARVRLLTGDYLEITSAVGLELLLDLEETLDAGSLKTRVIEVNALQATKVFHPKAWRFEAEHHGIAFVGSSNLSRSALESGIEWNLRVDRDRDREAYAQVRVAFEELWQTATPLTASWLASYSVRARKAAESRALSGEKAEELLELAPEPHQVQREALAKLEETRLRGFRRGLVVLATGLGKTWLAALDYRQLWEALGERPRLLFIAHRDELLEQAARTFRRLLRTHGEAPTVTWCRGAQGDLAGDLVFASVAKLARKEQLAALANQAFDYVVIDEVHHAAADSYRRVLDVLAPRFLLGLTATPDRADARDIYGLFDDNEVYRADIGRGISEQKLAPFHYFGVKDDIDYDHIPWRNKRFDPAELAEAVQTEARMATLWRAWGEHAGTRSLIFCCSVAHALYVRDHLRSRGVRVSAVFAAEGSDSRELSLRALGTGDLDAVCAVDLFNEGVDVPSIDRVIMLRPTESSVVFLQQLGRGLRASPGKEAVTVVDFVGNHKVFLERVRTLLSLGGRRDAVRPFLESDEKAALPEGCTVELELEAKQLLARLYKSGGADEVERVYRELRDGQEDRPTAGQLQRAGYIPGLLRERYGSWFEFVRSEGDLDESELSALGVARMFLRDVETTEMTRSFKMVALEALLEADALFTGLPLRELALGAHAILRRSPEFFADIAEAERADTITPANERRWLAYWQKNPIDSWTKGKAGGRVWFRADDERFALAAPFEQSIQAPVAGMLRELVDYRLAQYRARKRWGVSADGFVCRVIWNQRDPILKLRRRSAGDVPEGETDVRLSDGTVWQFRMAKEACNVAPPAGTQLNRLPDLLRRWFGPRAGHPGTSFEVRFFASPDGLWVEPVRTNVVVLPRRQLVAYPDLRAAAGYAQVEQTAQDAEPIVLPLATDDPDLFAVRASGSSMDGGDAPLRDGDWAVMRYARGLAADAVTNRVVLVKLPGDADGELYQIKRLLRQGRAWSLTSDNPAGPTFHDLDGVVPIARLEHVVRPEDLAPSVGTVASDLSATFGVNVTPVSGRHDGHLFVFIDRKGMLEAPDRVRFVPLGARPAETAFVLAETAAGDWRYCGVGRGDGGAWSMPSVDHATWQRWGSGRDASRSLPEGALSRAQEACDALLALPEEERWIEQPNGARATLVGRAAKGGLRIERSFKPRTVSLTDLGWVVAASADVAEHGGVLDEERVNRVRYLEGTPKGSTRWIDTQWALAAWLKIGASLPRSEAAPVVVIHVDGKPIDARFRVEPHPEGLSIVVEARGGTAGSKAQINSDYNAGLALLLERLKAAGLRLADAVLDTKQTADRSHEERRLQLGSRTYPVTIDDVDEVRKLIASAQAKAGRKPGARGAGNATRRIRLFVEGDAAGDPQQLRVLLSGSG
ncbi:MAG: DEAD/DEAH box helicase family protein [Myxococcales bacterium]|nr:DEAD/DEAH box helicase family protein [Myxococcales bacterium]